MSPSLSQSPHLNESLFPQSAKRGSEFNPLSCDVRSVRKPCQLWSLEPVLWSAVMVKLPSQMPQVTTKTHILIIWRSPTKAPSDEGLIQLVRKPHLPGLQKAIYWQSPHEG